MKRYKLLGVTEYAKKHLTVEDLRDIRSMIGSEIEESENKADIDGGKFFILPDLVETHEKFLLMEEIKTNNP